MLSFYFLSSVLAFLFIFSRYSHYDHRYFRRYSFLGEVSGKEVTTRVHREIPAYMWDIYNNGVNSSEVDLVKSVFPKKLGRIYTSRSYRNHKRKEIEFNTPDSKPNEKLVQAEVRITTKKMKPPKTSFQIYVKAGKWIFLDEAKISNVDSDWISLKVTPKIKKFKPGSIRFLILTFLQEVEDDGFDFTSCRPILFLSYKTQIKRSVITRPRRKRSLEEYEEETNKIWNKDEFSVRKPLKRPKNSCRRKPMYIKFSEIDYDSWIVAPSGYEAFQCTGKCTFPVSEHLSPTKHAILQTLLHTAYPSKAPRACCVPTKLEPISMLYIDGNGVLTYRFKYQDMVVAECGCR